MRYFCQVNNRGCGHLARNPFVSRLSIAGGIFASFDYPTQVPRFLEHTCNIPAFMKIQPFVPQPLYFQSGFKGVAFPPHPRKSRRNPLPRVLSDEQKQIPRCAWNDKFG